MEKAQTLANNHISVDCVVIGFDGEHLKVLLIKRTGVEDGASYTDMKLPGSLIYTDEDLDGAAQRVLSELTGLNNISLLQFKAFGSKDRTKNPKDVHWLERATRSKVESIVTIAYLALIKIDKAAAACLEAHQAGWVPIHEVGELAFDHNQIIDEAMRYIRRLVDYNQSLLFDLLPRKFTISQLRVLCERLYDKSLDVRNFHKKISQWTFIVPLEEKEKGVAHRAARYFKFDKKIFAKQKEKL